MDGLPPYIPDIEALREHLQAAIELEHSTIPPYLCALYSIRPGANAEAAEIIRTVAVQEMLHFVLAANVLNAVGGAPTIDSPLFVPDYPAKIPVGQGEPLLVPLRKFSPEAIDTFLAIERPAPPPPVLATRRMMVPPVPVEPGQLTEMVRNGEMILRSAISTRRSSRRCALSTRRPRPPSSQAPPTARSGPSSITMPAARRSSSRTLQRRFERSR